MPDYREVIEYVLTDDVYATKSSWTVRFTVHHFFKKVTSQHGKKDLQIYVLWKEG